MSNNQRIGFVCHNGWFFNWEEHPIDQKEGNHHDVDLAKHKLWFDMVVDDDYYHHLMGIQGIEQEIYPTIMYIHMCTIHRNMHIPYRNT